MFKSGREIVDNFGNKCKKVEKFSLLLQCWFSIKKTEADGKIYW